MPKFLISDTFTDSLARLSGQEQKAAKTTAFDLQLNPNNPRLKLHRIDRSRDKSFWSVRVNRNIRLIVHKTDASLMLCFVGHHDAAYRWAESRKIEQHSRTGAAQLVEVRERVEDDALAQSSVQPHPQPRPAQEAIFAATNDDELMSYGVPPEWLDEVRRATEHNLLSLVGHLPQEAAEALLELATGGVPTVSCARHDIVGQFEHPDAKRRFRVLTDIGELRRALDYPWEKWTIFLHPAQRAIAEGHFAGPARISGSAGTGKTVVALHRAVFLARRNPNARILLTTFWRMLANSLDEKLDLLVSGEPTVRQRIVVRPITDVCIDLYASLFGPPKIATGAHQLDLLTEAASEVDPHSIAGVMDEWEGVVDALQLRSWPHYRDFARSRQTPRLSRSQLEIFWDIFSRVMRRLDDAGLITRSQMIGRLTDHYAETVPAPFDHVVIEESQDLGIAEFRFLAAIGRAHADSLFLTGDLGQRIFRMPFSWKAHGIDIGNNSHILPVNYRTSHQIRHMADKLLPPVLVDPDGNEEPRTSVVSVFNGVIPRVEVCSDKDTEIALVAEWLGETMEDARPHEVGVFVRSTDQMDRARSAVIRAGLESVELTDTVETTVGKVSLCPMHMTKGLEFKAVSVMACDADVIPSRSRIEAMRDTTDLADVYTTERQLLYVACTRARERLLVTGVHPVSEFLGDMAG